MADMFMRVRLQGAGWSKELRLNQRTVSPIRIGTGENANLRVPKGANDPDYEFALYRSGETWNISVGEGVTCLAGGRGGNISRAPLQSGMALSMMGTRDGRVQQVAYLQADLQFDLVGAKYNRYVVIRDIGSITIGGHSNCDIRLGTPAAQSESVTLSRANQGWVLQNNICRYLVFCNASEVRGQTQVKDGDFFSVADVMFHLKDGNLYFDASVPVQAAAFTLMDTEPRKRALKYPQFLRSTRVQHQVEMDEINLLPPKEKKEQQKENMFLKLLPAVVMLVALVLFRGVMGSGNLVYMLYSVVTMAVSLVVSVLATRDQKKKDEEAEVRRKERYYQYIDNKIQEIKKRRQDELRILDRIYRSPEDNIAIVRDFEKGLFDRSSRDGDFLDIRLGSGRREATIKVKTNIPEYKQLDDDLQDRVQEIVEEYKYLDNAPIVARLGQSNSIGVVGTRKWLYEMLKVMTVDLMVRQYYKELRIYYVIDEQEKEQFAWARWLKNCTRDTDTIRTILCDSESTKFHLENIYKIISEREMNGDKATWRSHYVIFAYHIDTIRNHPISNFFETCARYGFHFIFMDEHEQRIPRGCSQMIQLDRTVSSGHLFYTANGENKMAFDYVPIVEDRMRELVSRLNPVYVMESSLEEQLTKSLTFYEMLGIENIEQYDLGGAWRRAQVEKTLAAPLGVKTKNAIVNLDLHDSAKAHGPHGLVAGTTGSGKSEILQSYILSMALHYHPYEVSFLLIDFKGGGMANQFRDLPHLAGAITDIDGREINRSLKSIRAEQERRKKFFAQVEVNNIHKYIAKYKADPSSVPAPLPHLIIIVDEFAELKTEQPDFMKELISTARVGRSLGIHLILATQKPSGVVDPQIWSNSKFKLCLKVQTKEDSREMLHTPLAAEIREPGRAYLQVGNNEIFELFQSGYSGANIPNADPNAVRPFKLHELNMWGKKTLLYEQKASDKDEKGEKPEKRSQLDVVVDYVHDYCEDMAIKKLPSICMPPLPETISLDELEGVKEKKLVDGIITSVAIYDDPEKQYQGDFRLNLTKDNTFIMGSAQTGKTTMLQSIMCSVIENYTPEEVNFYIIDAGNSAMQAFEKAKHVGGVAFVQEEEKINNLFKMMSTMIQERISKFMTMGIGTYHAYVEAGKRDMPQVVLVIDNIPAFREYYEQFDDNIQTLAREGLSAGISLMITGTGSNNLNYRTLVNFGSRIALNCNDASEYSSLFGVRGFAPFNYPGRGLVMLDNRVVEAQFALAVDAGKDATEKERADMLSAKLEANAKKYQHMHVPSIPMVPQVLEMSYIKQEAPELLKQPYKLVLGMEYSQVEFFTLDLMEMGYLAVSGRAKFGKKNVARLLLDQIQENVFTHLTDVYIFDGPKKELGDQRNKGCVKQYTTAADEMLDLIEEIYEEIENRQDRLYHVEDIDEREALLKKWPMKMIVVNGDKPLSAIIANKEAATRMHTMIAKCQECKVFVLFTGYPTAKVGTINVTEMQKYIQNTGNIFFMDNLRNMKALEVTLAEAREHAKPIVVGDGFLRRNDMYYLIKTVKAK